MGALDLSVQVLNISPRATKEDLIMFFSYCGTIEEIQFQRGEDQSQLAVVTFRQPYAFQTALLLNDAVMVDRRVRILPLESGGVPIIFCNFENKQMLETQKEEESSNIASNQVSDFGKTLMQRANTVISAAEQTLGNYIAKSSLWLSNVLDRTSKSVVKLGSEKSRNPDSRKQK